MEIRTKRLHLMVVTSADLNDVHELHSSPEVDKYNTLGLPDTIYTTAALLNEWLLQQQATPRLSYIFCVRRADTDQFAGLIALVPGKEKFRSAEVWYKLLPAQWGQGFATEALTQVLDVGFRELGLHRIEAGCAVDNTASMRVLKKAGMTREGRKRQVLPIRGKWVDNYFYAVVEGDWRG